LGHKVFEASSHLDPNSVYSRLERTRGEHHGEGMVPEVPNQQVTIMGQDEWHCIQEKLDDIRRQVNSQSGGPPVGIVQTLEKMQIQLKSDLPKMMARLEEMKMSQDDGSRPSSVLNNLGPSRDAIALPDNLSDVHAKLDSLLSIRQSDECKHNQVTTSPSTRADRDLRSAQALEISAQVIRPIVCFLTIY
jgi:hypothetical protein